MLGRTQNAAEHWREKEVEDGRMRIKKRRNGESTYMDGM